MSVEEIYRSMFGAPNYATVNGGFRNLVKNNIIEFAKRYANQKLDEAAESAEPFSEIVADKILKLKDEI